MSFVETVERARALLERNGRLSLRALGLEFSLQKDQLEALVEELVDVQQVAACEGKILVWMGPAAVTELEGLPRDHSSVADSASGSVEAKPERRPLTVLFCDLVGSADLSHRIDGEELHELMRAYHESAEAVISRYDGHVAQYLGDGLLVYFGFPHASEDDPERAVRAGLAIIAELDVLNPRLVGEGKPPLALRVGIHTGPVVLSEVGAGARRETQAVGEAMNVAARMQGEAQPDTVVMSGATLRLVRGIFSTRDLGLRDLKGLGRMHVHEVVRETGLRSRLGFEPERLTQLVGREQEMGLLVDRWAQVREDGGKAVLVSGEAGMGKSRLLRALRDRLVGQPHRWIECHCARDRQGSPYYPLLEMMSRGIGFEAGDTPEEKLQRLETAVEAAGLASIEIVPLVASLLSLPLPERYPPLQYSPELQQRKTIEVLCAWTLALAADQPVVMLVEDLHWCDPSTHEFLSVLLEQIPTVPVLLLLSFRPEFEVSWPARSHMTHLEVCRLGLEQAKALLDGMTRDHSLPREVRERIVARADGVPLYLEELTKMVLESGLESGADGLDRLTADAVPATLHASLMARLDRLGPGKQIAQLAAVLGRRFSHELLRAVAPVRDPQLAVALRDLLDAEMLFARGTPPDATYSFKHSLIQDTAYQSLLRSERRQLHAKTAKVLEELFPERAASELDVLARHYDEGGMTERAVVYYRHAASQATRQSANEEAIAHLRRAIQIVQSEPDGPGRTRKELELQLAIGIPLYVARGWANAEYGESLERARLLATEIGNESELLPIWMGLYVHHQGAGELVKAEECARHALELSERTVGLADDVVARGALSQTLYLQAEFSPALEQLERIIELYRTQESELNAASKSKKPASGAAAEQARARVPLPSNTAGAMSALWGVRSLCRWALGYPDQAIELCSATLESVRQEGTPFNLASACIYSGWIHQKRGERSQALAAAQEAFELCERLGFSWLPWTMVLKAAVRLEPEMEAEETERLVADIHHGIDSLQAAGTRGWVPHCYSALAEVLWKLERYSEALAAVDEGLEFAAETGQHYEDCEFLRLRGEISFASDSDGAALAEQALQTALETARRQQARSLELRAATSLARLWGRQGRAAQAHSLLLPVHDWFSEGFGTEDWQDAKLLLEELR